MCGDDEQISLRGLRLGPTHTGVYSHRRRLETFKKFWIKVEVYMSYVGKTKTLIRCAVTGADQLWSYSTADVCHCFRICNSLVLS